jgi:hypothetical protein
MTKEPLHIVELSVENFLGIADSVSLKGIGQLIVARGAKGVGKTSFLKSIEAGFKSLGVDPEVIHNGKDEAHIYIKLTDETTIDRKMSRTDNRLKVFQDGVKVPSPQAVLNALRGQDFSINPIEFYNAKPAEQLRIVLKAIPMRLSEEQLNNLVDDLPDGFELPPIDCSHHGLEVLETVRKAVYDARHGENQTLTRLQKAIEQDRKELPEGFDFSVYSDEGLKDKRKAVKEAQDIISPHKEKEKQLEHYVGEYERLQEEINYLEERVQLRKREQQAVKEKGIELRAELKKAEAKLPDLEGLQAEVAEYERGWDLAQKRRDIQRRSEELETVKLRANALDELHSRLAGEIPQRLLAEAPLPVKNLQIDGDRILVDGIGLNKRSDGEQLEFAKELGIATAGPLKILCANGIEQLDTKSANDFVEDVISRGFQLFVTKVSDDGELRIVDKLTG